ncbi:hypothetical protein EYF80_039809 [Liparis tanakae]|uniref:Uncharacterized protein n=1 Tax=Liparis tanakae TaxID=230148 RepID=A0A4Z2G9V3_9TELE|nr:hypothetical protein EYF80_039809 [Liparis tanakae]
MSWLGTRARRRRTDSAPSLTASYSVSRDAEETFILLLSSNDIEPLEEEQTGRKGLWTPPEPRGAAQRQCVHV